MGTLHVRPPHPTESTSLNRSPKTCKGDYVHNLYSCAKFGRNPSMGASTPLLWETTSELWCLSGGKRGDYQNCFVHVLVKVSLDDIFWAVSALWPICREDRPKSSKFLTARSRGEAYTALSIALHGKYGHIHIWERAQPIINLTFVLRSFLGPCCGN